MWYTLTDAEEPVPTLSRTQDNPEIWPPLQEMVDGFFVSTVFLGLDHQYGDGPPILWETMIFDRRQNPDSYYEEYARRYSSADAARAGHQKACQWVRDGRPDHDAT